MKRVCFLALGLIALAGCNNGSGVLGEVSGVIYDGSGAVVRNARVWVSTSKDRAETRSNSSGAYILEGVPEGDTFIQAEITVDGLKYIGQNVARVFDGERSKSVNIGVYRESQLAGLEGVVRDRFGRVIEGARVFAASANSLSGAMSVTDANGYYHLGRLLGGVTYQVNAGGRGYDADTDSVILTTGEVLGFDFILSEGSNPLLPAPQNLFAIAWTSPAEATRARSTGVFENIKRLAEPVRYGQRKAGSRLSVGGNPIEVDLGWDTITNPSLLGYGIYRARTANGASTAIDFLRDPFAAFFQDMDADLKEVTNYYYEITALNTQYPDTNNSESDFSNRYGVQTLGDMELKPVSQAPLTFRWFPASGAETYAVYLFDEYPSLGVDPIWDNSANRTALNQYVYNGPALQSGRRYYYIVLGVANSNDSRTISIVEDFVKN